LPDYDTPRRRGKEAVILALTFFGATDAYAATTAATAGKFTLKGDSN
jgi:hypothetical protein